MHPSQFSSKTSKGAFCNFGKKRLGWQRLSLASSCMFRCDLNLIMCHILRCLWLLKTSVFGLPTFQKKKVSRKFISFNQVWWVCELFVVWKDKSFHDSMEMNFQLLWNRKHGIFAFSPISIAICISIYIISETIIYWTQFLKLLVEHCTNRKSNYDELILVVTEVAHKKSAFTESFILPQ